MTEDDYPRIEITPDNDGPGFEVIVRVSPWTSRGPWSRFTLAGARRKGERVVRKIQKREVRVQARWAEIEEAGL